MLTTHTTAEVYNKFKALVDYLDLPGHVHQLLPPVELVTLKQLPVLDLHYHALAQQADYFMLNSTAFTSNGAWRIKAAYFFVGATVDRNERLQSIQVYAVGGGRLAEPAHAPKNAAMWAPTSGTSQHIINTGWVQVALLGSTDGSLPKADTTPVRSMCDYDAT